MAPSSLLPSVRAVVRSIDPQLPIFSDAHHGGGGSREHWNAATFRNAHWKDSRILALFLAALGLYAVLAYSVTQRTREIGIRIALGSPRSRIFGLIVRQGIIMDSTRHSYWNCPRARLRSFNSTFCLWRCAARSEDDYWRLGFVVRSRNIGVLGAGTTCYSS